MRLIYKLTTKEIVGVVQERVTAFMPESFIDYETRYIDIDYTEDTLKRGNKTALFLEENKAHLTDYVITYDFNTNEVGFVLKLPQKPIKTVLVDLSMPELHFDPDVIKYSTLAKEKGAVANINTTESLMLVTIEVQGENVGSLRIVKKGCCTWLYDKGNVDNRDYYPHYLGLYEAIMYLKEMGVGRWLDLGGFVDTDEDLNRFKRKWGEEADSTVL